MYVYWHDDDTLWCIHNHVNTIKMHVTRKQKECVKNVCKVKPANAILLKSINNLRRG